MDPTGTYLVVINADTEIDDAAVAATDLLCWLANDGAWPHTIDSRVDVIDHCRHRIFKALDRLSELEEA